MMDDARFNILQQLTFQEKSVPHNSFFAQLSTSLQSLSKHCYISHFITKLSVTVFNVFNKSQIHLNDTILSVDGMELV